MSGHTQQKPDLNCLLCRAWQRMPYAKRYSTPTTVADTEGALIFGFWIRARVPADLAVRLCERHSLAMLSLDDQQEKRDAAQANVKVPTPEEQALTARQGVAAGIIAAANVPTRVEHGGITRVTLPPDLPPLKIREPIPLERGGDASPGIIVPAVTAGTREKFRDVAAGQVVTTDEPQQGAKVSFICPICHKQAVTGELHACP